MAADWQTALRELLAAHVTAERTRWLARDPAHDAIDDILAAGVVQETIAATLAESVAPALAAARAALAAGPRWGALADALGLGERDVEWLALLVACELDPPLTRVLGYLDDATPTDPTPALAARVWGWPAGAQPGPGGPVTAWRLAAPRVGEWRSTSPWAVDADIAAYVAGADDWPGFHGLTRPLDVADREVLHPDLLAAMAEAVRSVRSGVEVELVGPPGSGRRTLLAQLAAGLGRPAVLLDDRDPVRAVRTARLLGALPVWAGDADDPAAVGPVVDPVVDPAPGAVALVARTAPAAAPSLGVRLTWTIPVLTPAQRSTLWERHVPPRGKKPSLMPPVVGEWDLTPADVVAGAAAAAAGRADDIVRRRLRGGELTALTHLPCPYEWDDLVVAGPVAAQLDRLRTQVQRSREVLDTWELRRLVPGTEGTTALFAGPSGTGKTMAAQVLARTLGLDLFRVDLAEVVNKYVGETEKRLARVFDQCERSHVMVLFDEADALFGQRTRTHDAHDRYANIEIDYLLQRLDTFTGVAVLATNRKSDLDDAFLRRLRVVVDFLAPGVPERARLWRLALPEKTSTGLAVAQGLDHDWLAQHLDLTGAEIKAVALAAAFDARAADDLVTMHHVLEAARRELGKQGAVLRAEVPVPPSPLVVAS
jgi:hypothetical protein